MSYLSYLNMNKNHESVAIREIDRDLHRTFPTHPLYQSEKGINSLRKVLVAYSWRNPNIGYCQSLNVVVALLLCFLTEEQTFWMIAQICEEILPDRYTTTMIGAMVDQSALTTLLSQEEKDVVDHIESLGITISIIALPWFLCMYIGYLPWEVTLLVLDRFFVEGVSVFFHVAIAVMMIYRERILNECEGAVVLSMLKNVVVSVEELTFLIDGVIKQKIGPQLIVDLREIHYPEVLSRVRSQQKLEEKTDRKGSGN